MNKLVDYGFCPHYRIYLKDDKILTIVHIVHQYTPVAYKNKFVNHGEQPLEFSNINEAIIYLNDNFKSEYIDKLFLRVLSTDDIINSMRK